MRLTEEQYIQLVAQQRIKSASRAPAKMAIAETVPVASKPAKYRNTQTDGFDSRKERDVWQQLELRAMAGEITELQRQVKFALVVNGIHVCDYKSDFSWKEGARVVVADVKSVMTRKLPAYRIKFKLMQACHGITLEEL